MQAEKGNAAAFSFWKMVLLCGAINLPLAILLLPTRDSVLPLIFATIIVAVSLSAWFCYKSRIRSIWFIPTAQVLLTVCVCIILLILDVFGMQISGGFIALGVGFLIPIVAILGLCWIIPSAIISAIYSVVKRKSEQRKECKNGKADPT